MFLNHQVNKTLGQFFPSLFEEYFAKWPPAPTKDEISKANGDAAVAVANIRELEETVCNFKLEFSVCC